MLRISFRILCGLCDSEVDFRSLGVILVVLGWLLGCVLGVLGCRLRSWDVIWSPILGILGSRGGRFWGSGGAAGRLRRAIASKDPWSLSAPLPFWRFWRPKGAQKASKLELKSVKNGFEHRSLFLLDFSLVSESFFNDFWTVFETMDLQKWAFGVCEVLFFTNSHFFEQSCIWNDVWSFFWRFGVPFWEPK